MYRSGFNFAPQRRDAFVPLDADASDDIAREGEAVRVPMMMVDEAREQAGRVRINDAGEQPDPSAKAKAYRAYELRLCDAWRGDRAADAVPALPTFKTAADAAAARKRAYDGYRQRLSDAWKTVDAN